MSNTLSKANLSLAAVEHRGRSAGSPSGPRRVTHLFGRHTLNLTMFYVTLMPFVEVLALVYICHHDGDFGSAWGAPFLVFTHPVLLAKIAANVVTAGSNAERWDLMVWAVLCPLNFVLWRASIRIMLIGRLLRGLALETAVVLEMAIGMIYLYDGLCIRWG